MALVNAAHPDFEAFIERFGHPGELLPPPLRAQLVRAGGPLPPPREGLAFITPPTAGHCHVCGIETAADQHLRAHAVARLEEALHPNGSGRMRLPVTHCKEHLNHAACSRDLLTPGSGILDGPGGYCEAIDGTVEMGMALVPGAPQFARLLKLLAGSTGLLIAAFLALQHSQGQQAATLQGTANQAVGWQDSVSGHGFNLGDVKILSGSAPADGDTAQSGTVLIDWILPNPLFPAATGFPSQLTANAISSVAAAASNTAGYGRLLTNGTTGVPTPEDGTLSTTQRRIQFSVGTSGADMIFNTLIIVIGGTCTLASMVYTHPA